jgi:phosphoglycerate dehydrogenase-like enzyme
VVFWNTSRRRLPYAQLELQDVLRQADILSLHLPLTPATRRLLDAAALRSLPDHALVINTARGEIIDQPALVEALRRGWIGGFAADVLSEEPPAANEPLLQQDNVLLTPHTASLTARTFDEMCVLTVQNTLALLAGEPIDTKYVFNHAELLH